MKIPDTIKVGHYNLTIEPLDHGACISEQCYGIFSEPEFKIKIDMELPPAKVVATLLHEINHAIFAVSGARKLDSWPEEYIVSIMANHWVQIYQDNPELLEYIEKATYA